MFAVILSYKAALVSSPNCILCGLKLKLFIALTFTSCYGSLNTILVVFFALYL